MSSRAGHWQGNVAHGRGMTSFSMILDCSCSSCPLLSCSLRRREEFSSRDCLRDVSRSRWVNSIWEGDITLKVVGLFCSPIFSAIFAFLWHMCMKTQQSFPGFYVTFRVRPNLTDLLDLVTVLLLLSLHLRPERPCQLLLGGHEGSALPLPLRETS